MSLAKVTVHHTDQNELTFRVAEHSLLQVSFHRTLVVPSDGNFYPLPDWPCPVLQMGDEFVIPVFPQEALQLALARLSLQPVAFKLGIDQRNVFTGRPWEEQLVGEPQDYLVCPVRTRLYTCRGEHGSHQLGLSTATQRRLRLLVVPPCRERPKKPKLKPDPGARFQNLSVDVFRLDSPELDELGELLTELLPAEGIELAGLEVGSRNLVQALYEDGCVPRDRLERLVARAHAVKLGVEFVDLSTVEPDLDLLDEDLIKRYRLVPLEIQDGQLVIATANPLEFIVKQDVEMISGMPMKPLKTSQHDIEKLLDSRYPNSDPTGSTSYELSITAEDFTTPEEGEPLWVQGGGLPEPCLEDLFLMEAWDQPRRVSLTIRLLPVEQWCATTGEPSPETPVTRAAYESAGVPWPL